MLVPRSQHQASLALLIYWFYKTARAARAGQIVEAQTCLVRRTIGLPAAACCKVRFIRQRLAAEVRGGLAYCFDGYHWSQQ